MPNFVSIATYVVGGVIGQEVAPDRDRPADVIIVTGERTPRSLQQTASSVAVVTGDEIDNGPAFDRVEQILATIPNVQLGSGGEGPTIRGQDTTGAMRDLPAFLGGNRPRTTLIVDGRAVSFNEFIFGVAPLWDVERIEVFRSPQTTTQGRNSIAGAIFVHSRDPTDEWEARARALIGSFQTRQLSYSQSGPIVANGLAFRVSGDWRKSRPSVQLAVGSLRGADPNRDEYGLMRLKLLATPQAIPGSRMEVTYSHSQSHMPGAEPVRPPFRTRRNPLGVAGVFKTNVDSVTASIEFSPNKRIWSRTLLSIGDAYIRRYSQPGLGENRSNVRDWHAETVADWKPSQTLRITGGLSYVRSTTHQRIDLSQLSGLGQFDDEQRSLGLFGEASWRFYPRFELNAGLRYQNDRQVRTGELASGAGAIPLEYGRSFDAVLPKVSLAFEIDENLHVGVLAQRAYNPGGATLRFDTGLPDELDAERLWDFELFTRATLGLGLNVRFNIFQSEIRDAQRSRPVLIVAPTGARITFADMFNVARARTRGAEADVDWRITQRLSLRAALGLLDTEIRASASDLNSLSGNEFQRSPHFTGALGLDWRPTDRSRLTMQLRHNQGYFSDDANDPALRIDSSTTVDARASWRAGRATFFGYARNLFDEFQMTFLFNRTLGTAADPRELGAGLEFQF